MTLPFSAEQFFDVFRQYNTDVWPAQVLLLAFALVAVALVFVPWRGSGPAIATILAGLWAWVGLVYHRTFFAPINPLAYGFAAVSVAGALIFLWHGVVRRRLEFRWRRNARSGVGLGLVVFALLVYPLWNAVAGHRYPALPTFGLPCPTTLFTVGLLAFLTAPYPRAPLVVPVLWCFVGAQAAFLLAVRADLGLLVAGLVGLFLALRSKTAPGERDLAPGPSR